MNDLSPKRTDKFRAYRARKRAQGLREIRLWVPDFRNPEVRARIEREAEAIRNSAGEKEALRWIEAVAADSWKDID
ncbi:DUF3018 family protein [Sphingomonas gilva]|uniref:DUF3018 family protein n=1 Tax=Sphingomonas gilva TaxID=2305907 RepID=A0A396RTU0_9SPHN|nr:antitoxin MazE-like protein [Sphingomonas gilva]RHW17813.1 DUF3018 family protein [Sphingomonas gilva]